MSIKQSVLSLFEKITSQSVIAIIIIAYFIFLLVALAMTANSTFDFIKSFFI